MVLIDAKYEITFRVIDYQYTRNNPENLSFSSFSILSAFKS